MQKLKKFISLLCVCFIMATLTFTVSCKDDKVSCDEAFKVLKQSMLYTSNVENYEKGFTCEWLESDESVSTLIESKSDLGDTNPDGEPWASEDAKKAFLDEYRGVYEDSKSFSSYLDKASYDLVNEKGYLIEKEYSAETFDYEVYATTLFQKESDGKYYKYDVEDNNKYLADKDFYMIDFNDYIADELASDEYLNECDTCNDFTDMLKQGIEEELDEFETNITVKAKAKKSKGNYVLTVNLNVEIILSDELKALTQIEEMETEYIVTFTFNKNYVKEMSATGKETYEQRFPINETEDSGYVTVISTANSKDVSKFSNEYDATDCPALSDSQATYRGGMPIDIYFNVNGYYVSNAYATVYCGEEVGNLKPTHLKSEFKDNTQWYLDEECTIPFTQTKWSSFSDNIYLYTNSESITDGYVFVGATTLDESSYDSAVESGSLSYDYYNYYVLKLNGMTASNCKYAYVNGTKVESGEEIVFVDGQTNYLIYITE